MDVRGGIVACMVILICLSISSIWAQPVAPSEVNVFERVNFIGQSLSFKLEPGIRHKLVWNLDDLNDKISSILVGSDVNVKVFELVKAGKPIRIEWSNGVVFRR